MHSLRHSGHGEGRRARVQDGADCQAMQQAKGQAKGYSVYLKLDCMSLRLMLQRELLAHPPASLTATDSGRGGTSDKAWCAPKPSRVCMGARAPGTSVPCHVVMLLSCKVDLIEGSCSGRRDPSLACPLGPVRVCAACAVCCPTNTAALASGPPCIQTAAQSSSCKGWDLRTRARLVPHGLSRLTRKPGTNGVTARPAVAPGIP